MKTRSFFIVALFIGLVGSLPAQTQRALTIPRGDARTLEFTIGAIATTDSLTFAVTQYYQETFSLSTNLTLRLLSRQALGGSDEQVFVKDSILGRVQVYLSKANTLLLSEPRFFYTFRHNDTTKFFGTITTVATIFSQTTAPAGLTTSDSVKFVMKVDSGRVQKGYTTITKLRTEIRDSLATVPRVPIDTTVLHVQKFKTQEDKNAGFADGDSVSVALGDKLPKSDTAALHAQKFKVLENVDGGKAGADSVHSRFLTQDNLNAGYIKGDSVSGALAGKFSTTDTSALLRKVDSNRVQIGYTTISKLRTEIKDSLNLIPRAGFAIAQLSDSLNANSRSLSWADTVFQDRTRSAQTITGNKTFAGKLTLTDSTKVSWLTQANPANNLIFKSTTGRLQYFTSVVDSLFSITNTGGKTLFKIDAGALYTSLDLTPTANGGSGVYTAIKFSAATNVPSFRYGELRFLHGGENEFDIRVLDSVCAIFKNSTAPTLYAPRNLAVSGKSRLGGGSTDVSVNTQKNSVEIVGVLSWAQDSTEIMLPTGVQRGGQATLGGTTGLDSVSVTVPGVLESDCITATYFGTTTAPTIPLYWRVWAANQLTFYGDATKKLSYNRIMRR